MTNPLLAGVAIIIVYYIVMRMDRKRRRKAATASQGIKAAARFWAMSLRPEYRHIRPEQVLVFQNALERALIDLYERDGKLPDIGVFYYEPYHYGADPLIWNAMSAARIVFGFNRDIDHGLLGAEGRMRVTLSGYEFVDSAC